MITCRVPWIFALGRLADGADVLKTAGPRRADRREIAGWLRAGRLSRGLAAGAPVSWSTSSCRPSSRPVPSRAIFSLFGRERSRNEGNRGGRYGPAIADISPSLVAPCYVALLLRTPQIPGFILCCSPAKLERVNTYALHSFVVCAFGDRRAGAFGLCLDFLEQHDLRAAPNVRPRSRGVEYGQRHGGSWVLLKLWQFGTCRQA